MSGSQVTDPDVPYLTWFRRKQIQNATGPWLQDICHNHDLTAYFLTTIYKPRKLDGVETADWADTTLKKAMPHICSTLMGQNYRRRKYQVFSFLDVPGSRNYNKQAPLEPFDVGSRYHHHSIALVNGNAAERINRNMTEWITPDRELSEGVVFTADKATGLLRCHLRKIRTIDEVAEVTDYACKGLKSLMNRYPDEWAVIYPDFTNVGKASIDSQGMKHAA